MDREPNDRLGRRRQRQLFEHRREILRDCSQSYTHANAYSYSNSYAHTDSNANSDCYCDGNTHRNRDSNSYTYFDTETFTDAKSCANAQGSSYSATAPVAFLRPQPKIVGPRDPCLKCSRNSNQIC